MILENFFNSIFNKRSLTLISSNFIKLIFVILLNRILTHHLDYKNLSYYYLIISTYTIFSTVIIGPFFDFVLKEIYYLKVSTNLIFYLNSFYKNFLLPVTILSFISTFLVLYFNDSPNQLIIPLLVAFILLFKTIFDGNTTILNTLGDYKNFSFLILFFSLFNLIFSYTLIITFESNFIFWLVGFIISNIFLSIISNLILIKRKSNHKKVHFILNRKHFIFSIMLSISSLFYWILTDGFRFISEYKFGLIDSGVLILGFATASQIFAILNSTLTPIFNPKLYKSFAEKKQIIRKNSLYEYFWKLFPFQIITLFITIILSKIILGILVDNSKINPLLNQVFIIGLIIEFIKSITVSFKLYTFSEEKTSYFLSTLILPSLIMFYSLKASNLDSVIKFAYYILMVHIIYLLSSFLMVLRLNKKK